MDDTFDYANLVSKYGHFRTPAAKLKVDGTELGNKLEVGVERISATLSLDAASAVTFDVVNAYDLKSSGFRGAVKSKLSLGAKVSLELGYGSDLTEVFQGYISGVSASFQDAPVLSITAMDVRRLMMEGTRRDEIHVVTSYSAAFQAVMERYSSLCPNLEVDDTDADEITQIAQKVSDYEFVTNNLATKGKREFFVLADKVYFREKGKSKSPITTLKWGEGLTSFSRNSLYQNIKITVIGFDPENKQAVKAEATETAEETQKTVGSGANETVIQDADAKEVEKARKRAEKEAEERKRKAQTGSAACVGLPVLVPGRFIKVDGLDSDLNKTYYIQEVRHEFGSDGFNTSFEIGGWD